MVTMPTLPKNISNDIIILPGIESVPVIPHESPAVVYADMEIAERERFGRGVTLFGNEQYKRG